MIVFRSRVVFSPLPATAAIVGCVLASCTEPVVKPIPPLNPAAAPTAEAELEKPAVKDAGKAEKTPVAGKITRMPLGDLYQLVQSDAALIYDVRPFLFYKMGHVPKAISWPRKDFERDLARQEPQIRTANANKTPVVVYCTDLACPDAQAVATSLAGRGHTVSILQGGYAAWKETAE